MPDQNTTSSQPPVAPPATASATDAGHVPITEEMDSAKWTLPPIIPVVIALAAVAVVIAIVAFANRPTPHATGAISRVIAAENGEGNVLVAVYLTVNNVKKDSVWIRGIESDLEDKDGKKYTDTAAPGADLDTYLQAAPSLAEGRVDPLRAEMKIPGQKVQQGMVIFGFPVTKAAFDARKSLTVNIDLYDNAPLALK